jgi:hypothetical protein
VAKLANELTWSVSRDSLFRQCRRAYYYQYYGSWGGWESNCDERTRKLYILKNLTTLPMWAGSIVHDVIAQALNNYTHTGNEIRAGALQARARMVLRNGWIDAVQKNWVRSPKKTNLFELYYGNGKSLPKEDTERVKETVYGCLQTFADSPVLKEILAAPYVNWKPVDVLASFQLEGLKVWVAVDFAYTDPEGKLRIIDWKTGKEKQESLGTQLACYALYANEEWFAPLEDVLLFGVFLKENARVSSYPVHADTLVEARDYILRSSAEMRSLVRKVETNEAVEEDFDCCESERVCQRCNFREVCPFPQKTPFR